MGEIEKLFKKLTVDNRILKNYFLGFNRISSSPTPDRALPEDSVLHCDWSSCWDHSRTLSKQKTNQKLPSASSAFLSTATFLPRQRAAHHQSNRQLIPAQPLSWCLCLPAPCYALIASDWDGVSKQCEGFCLSIVSDTSRSALEVLLQQSRFMIHVRAAAPFSKAAQTWGAQLESWRRSLIWGFPSRSTFIQPGKLSWYCYSSYKSSVVYEASNRNVSQVTYIRKKILMFLGLPTRALPAQYFDPGYGCLQDWTTVHFWPRDHGARRQSHLLWALIRWWVVYCLGEEVAVLRKAHLDEGSYWLVFSSFRSWLGFQQ